MTTINDNFKYLNVGLPEDIARLKAWGDIDEAVRLIDLRMKGDIPTALSACFTVEREMMLRLGDDYPYSFDEAMALVHESIPDFSKEEFMTLRDAGRIDWIYLKGEPRYFLRFFSTLLKTDPAIKARAVKGDGAMSQGEDTDEDEEKKKRGGESLLDRCMHKMQREGHFAVENTIKAGVRVNDASFVPGKKLCVHIPIPIPTDAQSDIKLISFSDEPKYIAPEDAAQRTVYFERAAQENREFFVEYSYVQTARYTDVSKLVPAPQQPCFFTGEQNPHIVFTPYIKALTAQVTEGAADNLEKARRIFGFITKNVNYSYMRLYFGLENIAENAARNFKGDCGVQALLFITMCRAAGIPAKWESGLDAEPSSVGAHDWTRFYIAPYGWLWADPSFGGSAYRAGNEERRWHYFGNLDPYRMVANREFQAPLDPPKKQWRGDPYDNQVGEVEYEDRGLRWTEYERDQTMTSHRELD